MLGKLRKEYAFFRSHPHNMKVLLATNSIYSLVLPIIELFVGTYIIRKSSDLGLVVFYQLAQYIGIPLTFLFNAYLLSRLPVAKVYAFGMMLSGISMAVMMMLKNLDQYGVSLAGLIMGMSYGFFWSNRVYLALTSTKDESRNYYYGLETFFFTLSFIVMPSLAGGFIAFSNGHGWFGGNLKTAYYILNGLVFLLASLAAFTVNRGQFKNPLKAPFLFIKFHPLWQKMMWLAPMRGLAQGYIVTAPVMLVMKLVGSEGQLGIIQSSGALLSAILLYWLGRKTSAAHRPLVFTIGLSLFALGSLTNAVLFSAAGAIFFVACLVFARPLMDLSYFPVQLGVMEFVAGKEKRNEFAYIFSHEVGLCIGRLIGGSLFIVLTRFAGEDVALRYALVVIAALQFISIFVIKSIIGDKAWHEPKADDLAALEKFKKPG